MTVTATLARRVRVGRAAAAGLDRGHPDHGDLPVELTARVVHAGDTGGADGRRRRSASMVW